MRPKTVNIDRSLGLILAAAKQGASVNERTALGLVWGHSDAVELTPVTAKRIIDFLVEISEVKTPFAKYAERQIIDTVRQALMFLESGPKDHHPLRSETTSVHRLFATYSLGVLSKPLGNVARDRDRAIDCLELLSVILFGLHVPEAEGVALAVIQSPKAGRRLLNAALDLLRQIYSVSEEAPSIKAVKSLDRLSRSALSKDVVTGALAVLIAAGKINEIDAVFRTDAWEDCQAEHGVAL